MDLSGKLATFDISGETFDRYMITNVRGPYVAIRSVASHMMRQRSGSIINISAAVGHLSPETNFPDYLVYGVSKAALKTNPEAAKSARFKPATAEVLGPALVFLAGQNAETMTGQWLHTDDYQRTWAVRALPPPGG